MGYSARRGFNSGSQRVTGAKRQAQMQEQIAQMQADMDAAQKEVEAQVFTASVGGGAVEASVNGKKEVLSVKISPDAADPDDVEMLQDLVASAVNEALRQAGTAMDERVGSVTSGLDLKGLSGLGGLDLSALGL